MIVLDIDECTPGHTCESCNSAPATVAVEWGDDYGQHWTAYCESCANKELARHEVI